MMPTSRRHYLAAFLFCAVQTLGACSSCDGDNNATTTDDMSMTDDGGNMPGDMDTLPDSDGTDPDSDVIDPDSDIIDPDSDMDTDMGGDADMDTNPGGEVVTCATPIPAPAAGSTCSATPGSGSNVILRGTVLAEDGKIYENGSVIYEGGAENGKILYVGCDHDTQPEAADATLIECAQGVIAPGTFNAHDHLTFDANGTPKNHGTERFDHRHDWREGIRGHMRVRSNGSNGKAEAVQYSELRHLLAGTTSIAGSGGASGFVRNLDQLANNEGLDGLRVEYSTFPLGDSGGDLLDSGCSYPRIDSENVLSENTIYLPHVSEGIDAEANNEFKCLNGGSGRDLIAQNTSIIHGIGLTAADIADMSASGSKLVWSPRTNIDLYGQTADIPTYRRLGVTIALGTDWIISGSMNMQRELACAAYLNDTHFDGLLTSRDLFEMATINGAIALGVDDRLGSLAVGKIADIAIYDGATLGLGYDAVISSSPQDVKLVMRGGKAVYGDNAIIDAIVAPADAAKCETIDVCGASQKLCAELDTGANLATIRAEAGEPPYPLFFCGTPDQEPSCVPFRPDEYTGMTSATDADGDGIDDAQDICPAIFNPTRPLDNGQQPNFDQDTDGDSCDVCPVSGPGDMCAMFDPDDRDSDTVPNAMDNCPATPNADQLDNDNDGQGDACDRCPEAANPNNGPCPATIYDINDGTASVGESVIIRDAVVSGAGTDGFFIQVPTDAAAFIAPDFSGLFVYAPSFMAPPTRGDVVEVAGTVAEFRGGVQLTAPSVTVVSSGPAPQPVTVSAADLLRTGAKGEAYEGLLVRVDNVVVEDNASYDQFGEVKLVSGLYIDDTLYTFPKPEVGDTFTSIIGNVVYRNFSASEGNRISPRDENDLVTGPAALLGFNQSNVFLETNQMNAMSAPSLMVELTSTAQSAITIDMTYSGSVSGPAQLTIPAGEEMVAVPLDSTATAGSGTVTASYAGDMFSATVTTFDATSIRTPLAIEPANASIAPGGMITMTVTFDLPGLQDGSSTAVVTTSAGLSAPAMVTIPAGSQTADIPVSADAAAMGSQSVTVSTNGGMITEMLVVSTLPSQCLIISEVVEGSSFDKAVEIFNCGAGTLTLDGLTLCQVNGMNTNCSSDLALTGSLAAGETLVICNAQSSASIKMVCDIEDNVTSFNGDDRLILFEEVGGAAGAYDEGTDTLLDAFGQYATFPGGKIWENTTYDRCNLTPYNGVDPFDVSTYFNALPSGTITGLGTAPVAGCN